METIKIIMPTMVIQEKTVDVNVEMVGQKAMGLLNVPLCWRLPFFVINSKVFDVYKNSNIGEREKLLEFVVKNLKEAVYEWNLPLEAKIIIRSSGGSEGMKERGKYESAECILEEVYNTLIGLYDSLLEKSEDGIAYIVQPYVIRKEFGHLSNERRLSQMARDWKLEYENSDKPVVSIGVRTWRKSYDEKDLTETPLFCGSSRDVKATLRKVAYYFCDERHKAERWHFEFVWNGNQIYIVQNDREELDQSAENPMDYPIQIDREDNLEHFNVLRMVNKADGKLFKKVQNALLYQKLGLTVAPLYILDNRETIVSLTQGIIEMALEQDIRKLVDKSIVIRTDVDLAESPDAQLLPRSNELRTFEDVMVWFQDKLPVVLRYNRVVLIIHIFIPAIAAAFAYATPKSRIVTIHSLWGLPESLYYNAHDTFLLDTGTKDVQHIDVDKILILNKKVDYKEVYIAPDKDGKWKEKKTKLPYDWRSSINDQQAQAIAKGSRMIVQEAGIALSIMWFVGIDKDYYQVDCLPWYHEKYRDNTFSHETYRKKYFTEKEVEITSEADLLKYEEDSTLRSITIHPKDDDTLRNVNFITKVGEFAKRKGITIFLEGTILAHPVYQLMAHGVRVVLANRSKELIDQMQFNKLVRDKIPDKIIDNMERIKCYKVYDDIKIRYLKEKLVEEAYEVLDASISEERCKELADTFEVLFSLRKECSAYKQKRINVFRSKELPINNSDVLFVSLLDAVLLDVEIEQELTDSGKKVVWNIERMHHNIELEIKVITDSFSVSDITSYVSDEKSQQDGLIEQAYSILDEKNPQKVIKLCNNMEQTILQEIYALKLSKENFLGICKKKKDINGGFDEGFVLGDTAKNIDGSNESSDDLQFGLDMEETEEYCELRELLFNPVTYIDYRDNENEELIIRIKYPLCFETWTNDFTGAAVESMFGKYKKVIITAERIGVHYSFRLYIRENGYEQLTFLDV